MPYGNYGFKPPQPEMGADRMQDALPKSDIRDKLMAAFRQMYNEGDNELGATNGPQRGLDGRD